MIFEKIKTVVSKTKTEQSLAPRLADYYCGHPQSSGALSVIPLFARKSAGANLLGPQSGLRLSKVNGYGNLELSNPATDGIAIVPLHIGYIQDRAQNHAACRSAFIGPGQKLMFTDACCVQQSQGGYLAESNQWFFILPLQLREQALSLRRQSNHGKLWTAIAALNAQFALANRGHLELILSKQRAYLTQFQSRFECLPDQVGALFLINDKLVGIEIAPNHTYFREVWMALVCFCYGVAAAHHERNDRLINCTPETAIQPDTTKSPLVVPRDLDGLGKLLEKARSRRMQSIAAGLESMPLEVFSFNEEERFLKYSLQTVESSNYCGQIASSGDSLIYASVFARSAYLSKC